MGILCNCKKKNLVQLDSEPGLTAPYSFLPGTYWIYMDSLNGRMDSFFVTSNSYQQQVGQSVIYDYHIVTISDHNIDSTNIADSALWTLDLEGSNIIVNYYYGQGGFGWKYDVQYSPLFSLPIAVGPLAASPDTGYVTNLYGVFTIDTSRFYNVAQVHQYMTVDTLTAIPGTTTINDWFYVTDDAIIVKMDLYHPYHMLQHVWQLVRYKIVR